MSLRLLIDEDTQAKLLVTLLKKAAHDVVTVNDVGLMGEIDPLVLDWARRENRVLLTQNCPDYEALHDLNPNHPGILAIYNENNPSKNMSFQAIVKAIANLEENWIQVPQVEIALKLQMHKQDVNKAMKLLESKGIILKGPKAGRSYAFRLNPYYGWKGKVKNLDEYRKREVEEEVRNLAKKEQTKLRADGKENQ